MLLPKTQYIRDKVHLKFIAQLPCLICNRTDVQAAHIRSGNGAGMGIKSGDDCTVPLCCDCHRNQHENGETAWWHAFGGIEKATEIAKKLHEVSGDLITGIKIVRGFLS